MKHNMDENVNNKNTDSEIPTLLTVQGFAKKHPFMTENALRWLIHKMPQGFEECLIRLSNRIFINEKAFFHFLSSQSKTSDSK